MPHLSERCWAASSVLPVLSRLLTTTLRSSLDTQFLFWHALLLTHLSQFAEDVIVMNLKKEVLISDAYATGSSLMPQKKNPDALELLRGKAGMALGRQVGFTATLKGLPRAYNKDLQEDKKGLFESIDTTIDCVQIATGVMGTMKVRKTLISPLPSPFPYPPNTHVYIHALTNTSLRLFLRSTTPRSVSACAWRCSPLTSLTTSSARASPSARPTTSAVPSCGSRRRLERTYPSSLWSS